MATGCAFFASSFLRTLLSCVNRQFLIIHFAKKLSVPFIFFLYKTLFTHLTPMCDQLGVCVYDNPYSARGLIKTCPVCMCGMHMFENSSDMQPVRLFCVQADNFSPQLARNSQMWSINVCKDVMLTKMTLQTMRHCQSDVLCAVILSHCKPAA